jgi:hypothetical protein
MKDLRDRVANANIFQYVQCSCIDLLDIRVAKGPVLATWQSRMNDLSSDTCSSDLSPRLSAAGAFGTTSGTARWTTWALRHGWLQVEKVAAGQATD